MLPGAFGDLKEVDAILNIQHDRQRPIARTGGGGLELADSPERLEVRASLPNTTTGQDAREMLESRILRGLSVEMKVLDDEVDTGSRMRTISRAKLRGLALCDRPAYGDSEAILKRFEVEDREDIDAAYAYGENEVIASSGSVRKQKVQPGAFSHSIEDPEQEITLSIGRDMVKGAIASKLAGTLRLTDDSKGLKVRAAGVPDTTAYIDYQKQVEAGMIPALVPMFRQAEGAADRGYADIPEPGNPGVLIREYSAATLYGLALVLRRPKGSSSDVTLKRSIYSWL